MNKVMEAREAVKMVCDFAAEPDTEVRYIDKMELGECARQGDVYITKIEKCEGNKSQTRQLADGTSQGSRHVIQGKGAVVYKPSNFGQIERVNLSGKECTRFVSYQFENKEYTTLTHPTHADFSIPPGCYQTTIQTDARTNARVRD